MPMHGCCCRSCAFALIVVAEASLARRLQVKMARKWQEREGTVEAGANTTTQEEIVEEFRRCICIHCAVTVYTYALLAGMTSLNCHLVSLARQGTCMQELLY